MRSDRRGPLIDAIAPWYDVCALADLPPRSALRALVDDRLVVVLRGDESVHALAARDTDGRLAIRPDAVIEDRCEGAAVATPAGGAFDARTGRCLDDARRRVEAYACRVRDGIIQVRA